MKKYEKIIRKQPGIVTTATTQQYRLNGEISAPFLKRERVPGHTTRLTGVPRDHPSHPGGYRDPKMRGIQGPKDAMGDLPLQSYGAATGMLARHSRIHIRNFGFYPPKKYPFGAIKSHPPAPPTIDHQVAQDERRKQ